MFVSNTSIVGLITSAVLLGSDGISTAFTPSQIFSSHSRAGLLSQQEWLSGGRCISVNPSMLAAHHRVDYSSRLGTMLFAEHRLHETEEEHRLVLATMALIKAKAEKETRQKADDVADGVSQTATAAAATAVAALAVAAAASSTAAATAAAAATTLAAATTAAATAAAIELAATAAEVAASAALAAATAEVVVAEAAVAALALSNWIPFWNFGPSEAATAAAAAVSLEALAAETAAAVIETAATTALATATEEVAAAAVVVTEATEANAVAVANAAAAVARVVTFTKSAAAAGATKAAALIAVNETKRQLDKAKGSLVNAQKEYDAALNANPATSGVLAGSNSLHDDLMSHSGSSPTTTTLANFDFTPFMDSGGGDIRRSLSGNVDAYAEECSMDTDCLGFNSNGWLKNRLSDESQWSKWTDDPSLGFYVKKA